MTMYAGFDVSDKMTHICVIDANVACYDAMSWQAIPTRLEASCATERIALQVLLHQRRKPVKPFAHIGDPGG